VKAIMSLTTFSKNKFKFSTTAETMLLAVYWWRNAVENDMSENFFWRR